MEEETIRWGLISQTDANTLSKTLDLILESESGDIFTTEIGVYSGLTSQAICRHVLAKNRTIYHTGIDNSKDGEPLAYFPMSAIFINGSSQEVHHQLEDNSQHLIFIDGCHCFAHVVSDFFCYADKVKDGGYIAFHDTGEHIKPFKDFQHGDKLNPRAYISVRDALDAIGLLDYQTSERWLGFELIYDEADPDDEAGGICVFKKLY